LRVGQFLYCSDAIDDTQYNCYNHKVNSRAGIAFGHAIADGGVHSNASGFGGEISWGGELNFK
jgi:hypothetical protein